jgi:hypothetical protein
LNVSPIVDITSSNKFFCVAASISILEKVRDLVESPWAPIDTVAGGISSKWYTIHDSIVPSEVIIDINSTRKLMWALSKPLAEGNSYIVSNLYVGFETGEFLSYEKTEIFPGRPLSYGEVKNHTCPIFTRSCLMLYYNKTEPISGTTVGPPTKFFSDYIVRNRPVSCVFIFVL